jgi:APA family basic amino acid/polyamine antiporter
MDTVLAKGRAVGPVLNFHIKKFKVDTLVINDTNSAMVRAVVNAVDRSSNTVSLWTFRMFDGSGKSPTPKARLRGESPFIVSETKASPPLSEAPAQ